MPSEGRPRPQTSAEELPEGELPADQHQHDGPLVYSLTAHALKAIERHRWIESEKYGHDCGSSAEEGWIEHYWHGWARSKLLEHFMGWRCWGAFGQDCFGLFRRQSIVDLSNDETIRAIAHRLAQGGENLDIIDWAIETGKDIDPIIALLDRIDINAKRHRLLTDHIRLFI